METERIVLNEARNVSLTAYLQPVGGEFNGIAARPAVLVIPGGRYRYPEAADSVITLGSFLRFAKLSEAAVRDIEEKLRAIPKDTKED